MDIRVKDIANACYFYETEVSKLESALRDLATLCSQPWLNEENRDACTALGFRIKVKILSLKFYTEGYGQKQYDNLKAYIEKMLPVANERNYTKTALLAQRALSYATAVYSVAFDLGVHTGRVRDEAWNKLASSREEAEEVKSVLDKKAEEVARLSDSKEIFGEQIRFPDIKSTLYEEIKAVSEFCAKIISDYAREHEKSLLSTCTYEVANKYSGYKYFPVISQNGERANALVVCTPVNAEFTLYAYSQTRSNPAGLVVLNAELLNGKKADAERVFTAIKTRGADCAVEKAVGYKGEINDLYAQIISFGKAGRKIFVLDESGNRRLYNEILAFCVKTEGYSALDASFTYLSMPDFRQVTELFEQKGMLTAINYEKVKSGLPFMGFIGLNEVMDACMLKRDWFMKGAEISRANEREAKLYIASAPSQEQFIDRGWGDFDHDKAVEQAHYPEFDYDGVRECNKNNVRKIMESEFSLFAKCGLLARYLIFRLEDASVWENLSDKEREIRLNDATKAIMKVLTVPFEPVVELLPKLEVSTWVGCCCDGGKKIQYRADYVKNNASDLMGTICHECYHAFQHTAINSSWHEWYWNLLGVTKGSLEGVRENSRAYFNGSEKGLGENGNTVYRVQIMECEARAFAINCLEESKDLLSAIDWE